MIFLSFISIAQESKYKTFKAKMELIGEKNGEKIQWENNNITVSLDYKTGNFISQIKNTDFYEKQFRDQENNKNIEQRVIVLKGIFPIERIIDQKPINATYNVDMELNTPEDIYPLNFNVGVTKPGKGPNAYRVFVMQGKIYNNETNFPKLKGFENEIEIIVTFNAFWNN
jgi:hypothetical protein